MIRDVRTDRKTEPLDPFTLAEEIDTDQKRLGDLEAEMQSAIIQYRDGRYQTLVAQAKLQSVRAAVDICKARLIAKQAILKSLPR